MLEISVIIPTFNPGDYIFECFHSLKEQTLQKKYFEVIIVLNGCNEPFYSKIKNHIKHHNEGVQYRLIQTNIAGVSNARNIGIEASIAKNICFMDDDDVITINYLSSLLEKNKLDRIVVSNVLSFNETIANSCEDYISKSFNKQILKENKSLFQNRSFFSSSCAKLIPKEIIGNDRFETKLVRSEDAVFMAKISYKIKNVSFTNKDAVYYRRIRNNSASRLSLSLFLEIEEAINLILIYLKIYFSNPFRYNLLFFISRIVAASLRVLRYRFKYTNLNK